MALVHGIGMAVEMRVDLPLIWRPHGCGDACGFDTALVHGVAMALEMHLDFT